MLKNLESIRAEFAGQLEKAGTIEEAEALKVAFLGRKGKLTEILRGLSALAIEERKSTGEKANLLREELENLLKEKTSSLRKSLFSSKLLTEKIDVSLPPLPFEAGHVHPTTRTIKEICAIFESLGFTVAEGPEIETDWYNFEALNIHADHPARDSQDTFYLADKKRLLRTQTSPMQIRVMEKQKPPLKILSPGRIFRNEATDACHEAMFHQVEGLLVDENVTFADLKGTLMLFIHRYFGSGIKVRFRPSYYPFTEPSADMDVQCTICGGKGCRVCKHTGWLEMLGCGMVHPNVFKAVKYDTEKYTGYAFGLGVERLTLFKYGIEDIRLFYEGNMQFLKQF
ncbi:MAG: phenylalanine--tRNA ligase subunit alpha [Elusimicrobiota bacterium]